jgi:hypothetical protein
MSNKLKVFVMALAGFLFTTIATLQRFDLIYVGVVTLVFAGGYATKNFFYPSISAEGEFSWRDLVSGLIVAVTMGLSQLAAMLATDTAFTWQILWSMMLAALTTYFTKTLPQGFKENAK